MLQKFSRSLLLCAFFMGGIFLTAGHTKAVTTTKFLSNHWFKELDGSLDRPWVNLVYEGYVEEDQNFLESQKEDSPSLLMKIYRGNKKGKNPILKPDGERRICNDDPCADTNPFFVSEYQVIAPKPYIDKLKQEAGNLDTKGEKVKPDFGLVSVPYWLPAVQMAIFHTGAAGPDKTKAKMVAEVLGLVKGSLDWMINNMQLKDIDPMQVAVNVVAFLEGSIFNAGQNGAIPAALEPPTTDSRLAWWRANLERWLKTTRIWGLGIPWWPWNPSIANVQITEAVYNIPETDAEAEAIRNFELDAVEPNIRQFANVTNIKNPIVAAYYLLRSSIPEARKHLLNYHPPVKQTSDIRPDLKRIGRSDLISSYLEVWRAVNPDRWHKMIKSLNQMFARNAEQLKTASKEEQLEEANAYLTDLNKNTVGAVVHKFFQENMPENATIWDQVRNFVRRFKKFFAGSTTSTNGLTASQGNRASDSGETAGGYSKVYHTEAGDYAVSFSATGVGEEIIKAIVSDIGGSIGDGVHPVKALLRKLQQMPVDSLGIIMIVTNLKTGESRAYKGSNTPEPGPGFPTGLAVEVQDMEGQSVFLTHYETGIYDEAL